MDRTFELKDLLAVAGVIGEVYAFSAKRSGIVLISIGIFAALFAITWAILERNNQRNFRKAVAYFFLIVGPLFLIFFLGVAVVVGFTERPPAEGLRDKRVPSDFSINDRTGAQAVEDSYTLKFLDGKHVTVTFAPSDESRPIIERMRVVRVRDVSEGQSGRLTELMNDGQEVAYELQDPSPSYSATLDFRVVLTKPLPSPPVKILVTYEYTQQPLRWRISKWIFDRFGE